MRVHCEALANRFDLPERPERVVSLSSGLTEALFEMGCGDRIAGVSSYCSRYVSDLRAPVVGDYLRIDEERFAACAPDLVLATSGIQLGLARRLAERGLPVYALPLPGCFHGILGNVVTLGALMNEMVAGRSLATRLSARAGEIAARATAPRPRVYVELWFGKHMRSIGGRTFIHDLVSVAGGDPLLAASREAYPAPDLGQVPGLHPDIGLFFWEPDYPVEIPVLLRDRGWEGLFHGGVIESTVDRGRNLIHDGPSFLETAEWLQDEMHRCR